MERLHIQKNNQTWHGLTVSVCAGTCSSQLSKRIRNMKRSRSLVRPHYSLSLKRMIKLLTFLLRLVASVSLKYSFKHYYWWSVICPFQFLLLRSLLFRPKTRYRRNCIRKVKLFSFAFMTVDILLFVKKIIFPSRNICCNRFKHRS